MQPKEIYKQTEWHWLIQISNPVLCLPKKVLLGQKLIYNDRKSARNN